MKSSENSTSRANKVLSTTLGVLSHLISTIAFFILFIGLLNQQAKADAFFQGTEDYYVPGHVAKRHYHF